MKRLANWLIGRSERRQPNFVIGSADRPYLMRWWLIPRNRFFNVYLHLFLRSDDDSALPDPQPVHFIEQTAHVEALGQLEMFHG